MNERGFSLISALIGIALVGIGALVFATQYSNSVKATKHVAQSSEATTVVNNVTAWLMNPKACTESISALNLAGGRQSIVLKMGATTLLATGQKLNSVEVASLTATPSDELNGVRLVTIELKLNRVGGLAAEAGWAGKRSFVEQFSVNVADIGGGVRECVYNGAGQGLPVVALDSGLVTSAGPGRSLKIVTDASLVPSHCPTAAYVCRVDPSCRTGCTKPFIGAPLTVEAKGNRWHINVRADSAAQPGTGLMSCAHLYIGAKDHDSGRVIVPLRSMGYNCNSQASISDFMVFEIPLTSLGSSRKVDLFGSLGYAQHPPGSAIPGAVGSGGIRVQIMQMLATEPSAP